MAAAPTSRPVDSVLDGPRTASFGVARNAAGKWAAKDGSSYYAGTVDGSVPVFTVGNGTLHAVVGPDGSLRSVVTFGPSREKLTAMPGGWVEWPRYKSGPLDLRVVVDGRVETPAADWPVRTSLLANVFPLAEYRGRQLDVRVVAAAPVLADGRRPRAMLWGVALENTSPQPVEGELRMAGPKELAVRDADGNPVPGGTVAFTLPSGARTWVPLVVSPADEPAATCAGAAHWLEQTAAYWRGVTGTFSMPNDPFTADLFVRKTVQALQRAALQRTGEVAGVLYGGYPLWGADNFKDCYYAILPATLRDPALARAVIPWFARYAVRPVLSKFPGGISHSLGNTLNATLLATLYYESTGDGAFFRSNPQFVAATTTLLRQVLATRKADRPWLFPSRFVSDGRALGDYHTGSNVCAWRAFKGWGRVLGEVLGDRVTAAEFDEIAGRIKADLDRHNIVPGPFGPQYIEGTDADGSVPVCIHDGEESDTTLMPFYGYAPTTDLTYRNYLRFAVSPHNVAFHPETRGIVWETYGKGATVGPVGGLETGATFPSYITGLAADAATGNLRSPDGCLGELRRLTDADGSWWWWPYGNQVTKLKRGQDLRRGPFQCGWAEGAFVVLFQTNALGIRYDAVSREFRFSPVAGVGDYDWGDFPIGNDRFSVGYHGGGLTLTNHSASPIRLTAFASPTAAVAPGETVRLNP